MLGVGTSIFVLVAWIARTRKAPLGKLMLLAVVVALGCMNGLALIAWQRCRNGCNKKHDGTADPDRPSMHPGMRGFHELLRYETSHAAAEHVNCWSFDQAAPFL